MTSLSRLTQCGLVAAFSAFSCASFAALHELPSQSPSAVSLSIASKNIAGQNDKIFVDGLNREVSLRGFNVSGQVKLAQFGFQPFANAQDAQASFSALGKNTGSNMVRYTVAWEGIQPSAGTIDTAYLDNAVLYMKAAIAQGQYVLVDYHSDLYSRHTFKSNSKDTGNGAPKWAVHSVNGKDDCSLPCELTWSAHKLSDSAVRNAMKSFWYDFYALNEDLPTAFLTLPSSNQCADISGGKIANSTEVLAWSCHGGVNQQWQYKTTGEIKSQANSNYCLDVNGAYTSNGTRIQLYKCNGTRSQQFILGSNGLLHSALDFNKCLQNSNGKLKLYDCKIGNTQQKFGLKAVSNGEDLAANLLYVQSEFVWQIGQVAQYLKSQLSAYEWAHILGFEPLNEPFDGGLGAMSYAQFDNQLLWPFYQRVRAQLNQNGILDKPVFAEPMVFWSSITGAVAPATGGHYLNYKPGDGFVFTPHFYDQARMGVNNLSVARNAAYFENLDLIRDEARFLNTAVFLSEFGMWLNGWGHTDTERVVNGTYQAMESSDRTHGKNRFVDFYTPLVSGAQWQWDYYYDHHYEYQNGNTSMLKTGQDAWNNENFSVINNYAQGYNIHAELVERAYPRAVQGRTLHFAYEGLVPDRANSVMSYHSIRAGLAGQFAEKEFFRNNKFAFLAWQGRNSHAPTELYIPRHISAENLVVVTDAGVFKNLSVNAPFTQAQNEVALISDPNKAQGAGHVLLVWDDVDANENTQSVHFALAIDGSAGLGDAELTQLQAAITERLASKQSPVYLIGAMTTGGYAAEK